MVVRAGSAKVCQRQVGKIEMPRRVHASFGIATALEGKYTTCAGGGDTETGVDSAGHLYFADLTLANFSTSRSDDHGASVTCSNTGVPDAVVDRQWYAFDGDPTNGGSIYLVNDECAQSPA